MVLATGMFGIAWLTPKVAMGIAAGVVVVFYPAVVSKAKTAVIGWVEDLLAKKGVKVDLDGSDKTPKETTPVSVDNSDLADIAAMAEKLPQEQQLRIIKSCLPKKGREAMLEQALKTAIGTDPAAK